MKTLLISLVLALSLSSIVHAQNWQQQQYQQQQLYNQEQALRNQQQMIDLQRQQMQQQPNFNYLIPAQPPVRPDWGGSFNRGYQQGSQTGR
jgi:type II secretory pathway pseudopilin PulG